MDVESQVAKAMQKLERNIEKASRNPQAVLQGSFSGTSRNVTVWVDSLGRTDRYRITPNSVAEGDELLLMQALDEATRKAREKAENLDFDEDDNQVEDPPATRNHVRQQQETESNWDEEPGSWLR